MTKSSVTKKTIWLSGLLLCFLCACDDQLDIVPKGQITLSKVSELELLLNQEYMMNDCPAESLGRICGESLGMFDQVASVLSQKNTCAYAFLTGSESVDRAVLTGSDSRYNALYRYISYMNVITGNIDDAVGDDSAKPSIKAEARVMRAYLEWLAVALYARQYDASYSDDEGGVPYPTSISVSEQKTKLSLADTYARILEDVSDEVIADLPDDRRGNVMRGDKAWGNAVRAVALFQMKRYDEALPYARKALALRPDIFDRSQVKADGKWIQSFDSPNNIFYMEGAVRVSPTMVMLTPETFALFETDDYVVKYEGEKGWSSSFGESMSGLPGCRSYYGWDAACNVYGLTSEMLYYLAAECLIRAGQTAEGLALVDQVRQCRVENAQPSVAGTEAEAMELLRKAKWVEQIGTPFNFIDCKRWNSEVAYRRTIVKDLGSFGTFEVAYDSKLWIMAFPANAVRYNASLTQNY